MSMKKVVWISPHIPYDSVRHAGGQTHNFYIKKLVGSKQFEVRLVSSYLPDERQHFTLDHEIRCDLICNYNRGIKRLIRDGLDVGRLFFPLDRYGNHKTLYNELMMIRILQGYKKEGFIPDVLIIEWLQSLLSVHCFRKIFPEAKIIGIEEDVVTQSYTRKWRNARGMQKFLWGIKLTNIRREEVRALKTCSRIIANNTKDVALLKELGFEKNVVRWAPYYHKYTEVEGRYGNKVIYYGDMHREENYTAAEWFIREVMPLLKDKDIVFQVIGSNPPEELKRMETDKIQVTGYQERIEPFLEEALCMIAPLKLGAGIKIKVLEAMSAGLPVLTNEIGIEGIPARDGRDYIHCQKPEDYAAAIGRLAEGVVQPAEMGANARHLVQTTQDYEQTAESFLTWVAEI